MARTTHTKRYETEKALMISEVEAMAKTGLLDRLGGSIATRLEGGNILMTPTTASFRRWKIDASELVVMDPRGDWVEGGDYKAAAAAPLFVYLFAAFPRVGAIAHSHCQKALAFASAGLAIPSATNGAEMLGEIPCIVTEESDTVVKERALAEQYAPDIPTAFVPRPEVYAVNQRLGPVIEARFRSRADELDRHGLAFTLIKHGLFTLGRHLGEATENIERVEAAARAAIDAALLMPQSR